MSVGSRLLREPALRFFTSASLIALSSPAWAYRPFDGTDAAVAAPGEVEIELQPAGPRRDEAGSSLVAPAAVFNFGLNHEWEAVLEGQGQTPLSPGPTALTAAGAFLKHVIVPGSLQDKTGPSVATEFGVLLPDSTGIPASERASPALSRSGGTGVRSTSTWKRGSRAIITPICFWGASSRDPRPGQSGQLPSSSTKKSSDRRKRCQR